ncbi:sodium:solute symporter family protein [Abyssisolibacter fermentans]|uniref:sodium:solute symporter family protein n=1 Tax=Abyssisolibacter fermentans TaxID=1766203 RepID=UPI000834C73A|nr:sodium:solute symporter family protein [Abyssisolibacter fermentans]
MKLLDIIGVLLVFIITGYIGYRSSKSVKSMNDFTLGGRNIGKIKAGFSMAATEFGGSSFIGAMAFCYTVGLSGVWWDWCAVPAFLLLGIFFAAKIKLPNLVTITDFFDQRYDKKTKYLCSFLHILATVAQIAAQFTVGAVALNGIVGIPINVGLFLTLTFVVLYTISGGFIAVVNTDIVQFVFIIGSILISVPIAIVSSGGVEGIMTTLPENLLRFDQVSFSTVISWTLFSLFSYATSQHYIQRIFASKDKSTAKFSFIFTGVMYIFYGLLIAIIGICIIVLIPNLDNPNLGYALFVKNYLPVGISGLALGSIFAASMSTADSMILAASTLFVNDIYIPYKEKKDKNLSQKQKIRVTRIITVLISIGGVIISFISDNLIDIAYLGGLFYSTAVFMPLILGLYWKRATTKGAYYSIITALIVGLYSNFFLVGKTSGILSMPSNILAVIAGTLVLISISIADSRKKLKL